MLRSLNFYVACTPENLLLREASNGAHDSCAVWGDCSNDSHYPVIRESMPEASKGSLLVAGSQGAAMEEV